MNNPLIPLPALPFDALPFDVVKTEHFLPAIEHYIEKSRKVIASVRSQESVQDFKNTFESLEFSQLDLQRVTSMFFNLNSAETSEEMQALAQKISPLLSAFSNDILLDEKLFNVLKSVPVEAIPPTRDAKMLHRKTMLAFERNGAHLSKEDKETLRGIDQKLGTLSLTFGERVLRDTNAYSMVLTQREELEGLPEFVRDQAAEAAEEKGLQGQWMITLKADSYINFMKYSARRDLREKLFKAFAARGMQGDATNEPILLEIVELRRKRAQLLGYESHADYVLQERMAKNPHKVLDFLDGIRVKALSAARIEIKQLEAFAQSLDALTRLEKWDVSYYLEKWKKQELNIDDEALKPYLSLERVQQGIFGICERLFDLKFHKNTKIPVYHSDVEVYEVTDNNGDFVSLLYLDLFPRDGKRAGAWMTSYRDQYVHEGKDHRPHISIVCNFNRPAKNTPARLTFQELTTLFHEFGHALHGMLSKGEYPGLSGTNVYWDFVELPSQLFENWCYEKEALDLFAQHEKTGETIPDSMVQSIRKQRIFFEGYQTIRQLSFGLLDMQWHHLKGQDPIPALKLVEEKITSGLELLPSVEETFISPAFSHIFQGGYAAGYYSYKWSEMLEAQAFRVFERAGIFNKEKAKALQDLLASGGSVDPYTLFVNFVGEEPHADALLKRSGLI